MKVQGRKLEVETQTPLTRQARGGSLLDKVSWALIGGPVRRGGQTHLDLCSSTRPMSFRSPLFSEHTQRLEVQFGLSRNFEAHTSDVIPSPAVSVSSLASNCLIPRRPQSHVPSMSLIQTARACVRMPQVHSYCFSSLAAEGCSSASKHRV